MAGRVIVRAGIADRIEDELADLGRIVHMGKPFSPRALVKRIQPLLGERRTDDPSNNDD